MKQPDEAPPQYQDAAAAYPPHGAASSKAQRDGYLAVRLDDHNDSGTNDFSALQGTEDRNSRFRGVSSDEEWVHDQEQLLAFLVSQRPKPAQRPAMMLRLTGTRRKVGDVASNAQQQQHQQQNYAPCFSFTIPLPAPVDEEGTLFAYDTDLPRHRQSKTSFHSSKALNSGKAPSTNATLRNASLIAVGTVASEQSIEASVARRRSARPLWHGAETNEAARKQAVLNDLSAFIDSFSDDNAKSGAKERWLCAVTVASGWDLEQLDGAINRLAMEHGLISGGGWLSSPTDLQSIEATYEPCDNWLNLCVVSGRKSTLASARQRIEKVTEDATLGMVVLSALLLAVPLIAWLCVEDMGSLGRFVCWILALLALAVLCYAVHGVIELKRTQVTDTIGLSYALKQWVPTGCPASYSRAEVEDTLLSSSSKTEMDEELKLQRRTDRWYVLRGTREGDWLNRHADRIMAAMRARSNGHIDVALGATPDLIEGDDDLGFTASAAAGFRAAPVSPKRRRSMDAAM